MSELTYTDPALVAGARVTDTPRSGQTVTGYGGRIPTPYMLSYAGHEYRVYAMCYGNAASLYVTVRGVLTHLDTDTEHVLERVRDGKLDPTTGPVRVWFLWFGGPSYSPGYVDDDTETAGSLAAVVDMCQSRYDNRDGTTPGVGPYDDPNGRTAAWVWHADPRGQVDPYPDRIITRGPRGAWNVSRA